MRLIRSGRERDVVLYTRADCPLCDEAHATLRSAARRFKMRLTVVDIAGDPRLGELWGLEIPVVFIDGRKRFFGRVDPILLARELRCG